MARRSGRQRHISFHEMALQRDNENEESLIDTQTEQSENARENESAASESRSDLMTASGRSQRTPSTRSLSISSSCSSFTNQFRRIFIGLFGGDDRTSVQFTQAGLETALSTDLEDSLINQYRTRKLTLYTGPLSIPEDEMVYRVDDETGIEDSNASMGTLRLSASSHSMASSGANHDDFEDDDDTIHSTDAHVFLNGTELIVSERSLGDFQQTDECLERHRIEISRGKGGMFTRCTYQKKLWKSIRDYDLRAADLVVLISDQTSTLIPNTRLCLHNGHLDLIPSEGCTQFSLIWLFFLSCLIYMRPILLLLPPGYHDEKLVALAQSLHSRGLVLLFDDINQLWEHVLEGEIGEHFSENIYETLQNLVDAEEDFECVDDIAEFVNRLTKV